MKPKNMRPKMPSVLTKFPERKRQAVSVANVRALVLYDDDYIVLLSLEES